MTTLIADTSVAVPALTREHAAHERVMARVRGRDCGLATRSALETDSVLTRLPEPSRLVPSDAARLIAERFSLVHPLAAMNQRRLVADLADRGVAGGAVYDALIAATALEHDATLLTRDRRAAATYIVMGVTVEFVD